MRKILIIEDEEAIAMALEDDFRLEGYEVITVTDGEEGLKKGMNPSFDVIILDVMLPKMSGFDLCRSLRKEGCTTPVIMLTAKSQEIDKILGFEIGADDYMTKPFSPGELQARVRALIRRNEIRKNKKRQDTYQFGNVLVDFNKYVLLKEGNEVKLTSLEFSLLRFLLENSPDVLSRSQILDAVWGDEVRVDLRTVDTHVAKLRKKIEDDPSQPSLILGVRGVGYKFVTH